MPLAESEMIFAGQDFYVPHFQVKIAGRPQGQDVIRDILSVSYKDNIKEIDSFERLFLASKQAYVDAGIDVHYKADVTRVDLDRKVGEGVTVRVDASGKDAFGEGEDSVFALLDGIAADLRAGTPVSGRIDAVRDALDGVIAAHATVGAQHTQLQRAESVLKTAEVDLEAQRSKAEDIDLAKVILDLNVQSTVYQAALNVTARVLQPSLMDFLR